MTDGDPVDAPTDRHIEVAPATPAGAGGKRGPRGGARNTSGATLTAILADGELGRRTPAPAGGDGGWADDDWVAISALQHYSYCPRQCGLIHVDQVWLDNSHTLRGTWSHQRVDDQHVQSARGLRIVTALPVWSERLGLVGKCDAVELRDGVPFPVEFKIGSLDGGLRGHRRNGLRDRADDGPAGKLASAVAGVAGNGHAGGVPGDSAAEGAHVATGGASGHRCAQWRLYRHADVQLAAQALCLEEMFGVPVREGAVYHVASHRRRAVRIDDALRERVADLTQRVREMLRTGTVPPPVNDARCEACSLKPVCVPEIPEQETDWAAWLEWEAIPPCE